jgi:hypothetical protein
MAAITLVGVVRDQMVKTAEGPTPPRPMVVVVVDLYSVLAAAVAIALKLGMRVAALEPVEVEADRTAPTLEVEAANRF